MIVEQLEYLHFLHVKLYFRNIQFKVLNHWSYEHTHLVRLFARWHA